VQHAFLVPFLPSLHNYDVKRPNFTFYERREQYETKRFIFSFSELRTEHQAFGIQLEKNSLTFHKLNEMEFQSEEVLRSANSLFV